MMENRLRVTIRVPRKYGDENKNLLIKDWCIIKKLQVSNVDTYVYPESMMYVYWII